MAEYVPKLGELARETDQRDAIHVAVVPVKAVIDFRPGETHCAIVLAEAGTEYLAAPVDPAHGRGACAVVDPFLKTPPKEGERFWALLYPGTVVGLRHVYYHPALDAVDVKGLPSIEGGKVAWVKS